VHVVERLSRDLGEAAAVGRPGPAFVGDRGGERAELRGHRAVRPGKLQPGRGTPRLPIARTVPLAQAVRALTELERNGTAKRGKLIITPG
jgi:hypothetical protein